uniref:G-protein coupled receptors family 1 profile domain-containing protein n=1 Tax=Plectus sambesii TaxID=2011161 RepID=A0A914WX19_9BILA
MVIGHGFDFIRFHVYSDPCQLVIPYRICVPFRIIPMSPTSATILSPCTMVIERCWSTYRYRTYEKSSATLGVSLIIFQWTTTLLLNSAILFDVDWDGPVTYCAIASINTTQRTGLTMALFIVIEVIAFSCFYGLLLYNKRRKTQLITATLTEKYQIDENIRAIKLMIPMILTHTVCFLPPLCLFAVYLIDSKPSNPLTVPTFEELTNWTPIYCASLPLVLFWRHRALRINLLSILTRNSVRPLNSVTSHRETEQQLHFTALNNSWASALELNHAQRNAIATS